MAPGPNVIWLQKVVSNTPFTYLGKVTKNCQLLLWAFFGEPHLYDRVKFSSRRCTSQQAKWGGGGLGCCWYGWVDHPHVFSQFFSSEFLTQMENWFKEDCHCTWIATALARLYLQFCRIHRTPTDSRRIATQYIRFSGKRFYFSFLISHVIRPYSKFCRIQRSPILNSKCTSFQKQFWTI